MERNSTPSVLKCGNNIAGTYPPAPITPRTIACSDFRSGRAAPSDLSCTARPVSLLPSQIAETIRLVLYCYSGSGITENLHDLLEYDPANDAWTPRESLPGSSKFDAVAFSIDGKGYLGSGSDEQFNQTTDFYEYTPDTTVATSVNSISTNEKLQILPDPIIDQGMIILQSDKNVEEMKAQIFSEEGKEISSTHLQRQTSGDHEVRFIFSRDKLPKGIYLVFMKSNNQLVASGKMLLQ